MPTSSDLAVPLIQKYEGLHRLMPDGSIVVYRCPAGIPTIGYGHVCRPDHPPIDREQATAYLRSDMQKAETAVLRAVTYPLTDSQFSALVSFTFNVGSGNFRASTLRRKVNAGDLEGAADEFRKWRFAGGKPLAGLLRRRLEERALFLS